MQIIIRNMSNQSIIDLANVMSRELDKTTSTTARPSLVECFEELCNELEYRGLPVSDSVVCPESL